MLRIPPLPIAVASVTFIVQTKPGKLGMGAGRENFRLDNLNSTMPVAATKYILEARGMGIRAADMTMMTGWTVMEDHQKLGEFVYQAIVKAT